jgi:ABC-type transport system involved in multi-copper enzyme maturation permease subunit
MFGPTPLRDIFLVAGFELRDMTRSRRAFLFATLYLIVAAIGSYGFVDFLSTVQPLTEPPPLFRQRGAPDQNGPRTTADQPGRPGVGSPAVTGNVRGRNANDPLASVAVANTSTPAQGKLFQRGSPFRELLRDNITDQEAVAFFLSVPPITLFHLLISLVIMPFVIMLTSSESIAQEHQLRGVRFVALRTGRGEFVLGKVLGQGVTIALLTLLAGGMCMAIAWWKLSDFEFFPTLTALLLFWPRLFSYCAAFLGLAALCSMNSSSTVASRTFSIIGVIFLWITHRFALLYLSTLAAGSAQARAWNVIDFLTPYSHQNDLWYPETSLYGGAMASLAFLAILYIGIGLIFYRRRDL